jgi:hypothetical protein
MTDVTWNTLLDDIPEDQRQHAFILLDTERQRTMAEIEGISTQMADSWAGSYTTQYITAAVLGSTLAINATSDGVLPLPSMCVVVDNNRHGIPDPSEALLTLWEPFIEKDTKATKTHPIYGNIVVYNIRKIPVYPPVNEFHEGLNKALIMGQAKFTEASQIVDDLFTRREALARKCEMATLACASMRGAEVQPEYPLGMDSFMAGMIGDDE